MIRPIEDLMPQHRRAERRARTRARRWTAACIVYGLLALSGSAGARLVAVENYVSNDAALEVAKQRRAAAEREVTGLREIIRRTELSLERARAVGRHPDWSVLLELFDGLTGPDIMLSSIDIHPNETRGGFRVTVEGLGVSQSAVARFVVDLEQTGIFTEERLLETRRVRPLGVDGVAFGVEALIGAGPVPAPAEAGR